MPVIVRNAHFQPEHEAYKLAEQRKFDISKHRADICKHVERAIAGNRNDGSSKHQLQIRKFSQPTNTSMMEKIAVSKAKLEKVNDMHRSGLNLKLGAQAHLESKASKTFMKHRRSDASMPSVTQQSTIQSGYPLASVGSKKTTFTNLTPARLAKLQSPKGRKGRNINFGYDTCFESDKYHVMLGKHGLEKTEFSIEPNP